MKVAKAGPSPIIAINATGEQVFFSVNYSLGMDGDFSHAAL